MYQLFYTPNWFNGYDLIFEGISLIIAFLIAGYSWRIHKLSKENKYAYFSFAFILLGIGLFFKLFTHSVLYYETLRTGIDTIVSPITGGASEFADLFYRAAFFLQMLVMLGGWLLMFFVSQKPRDRLRKYYEVSQIALFGYLIFLISFVSNFKYFVFYLTGAVILALTVLNYYKNYLNTDKNRNALLVMTGFLFLLLSNVLFVFVFLVEGFYVLAEISMLIGFLTLLAVYRKVRK